MQDENDLKYDDYCLVYDERFNESLDTIKHNEMHRRETLSKITSMISKGTSDIVKEHTKLPAATIKLSMISILISHYQKLLKQRLLTINFISIHQNITPLDMIRS